MIETDAFARPESNMTFAGVVAAIAERVEMIRNELRVVGDVARRHHIGRGLLRIVAGEQAASRWPATGRGVGLREAQTLGGEAVEVWRIDLAAEAAGV